MNLIFQTPQYKAIIAISEGEPSEMADWKLVSDQKVKKWELYNPPNDSTEMYDLAGKNYPRGTTPDPVGEMGS